MTFSQVGFAYHDTQVVQDISLTFRRGTHTVVTGSNGSGKSTLLALAAGVLRPTTGRVATLTGGRPAFVIQHTRTSETMPCTVRQAVEMGRWERRRSLWPLRAADHRAISAAMERMGIEDLAERQLNDLSGGQRQRSLIAQGLAQDAEILILDEPTAGVDLAAQELIRTAVDEELRRGVTVLEASHDPRDISRAARVLTLERGLVVSDTRA
ncbi:zinc ABC transporter ATP-binding protein AztA [Sinomonas mesophila]|uniref:zinc ABC transporter ATP-binding protein AztA n=1 Tax=Sinomonas mesophila TaxID=1531955 RepID=UPI00098598CC|nr:zinc ABC transporter ATP-binding protein AztA [Sinomonas mesophila]